MSWVFGRPDGLTGRGPADTVGDWPELAKVLGTGTGKIQRKTSPETVETDWRAVALQAL